MYRGAINANKDLDTIIETGFYYLSGGAIHFPSDAYPYGVLEVYTVPGITAQRYIPHTNDSRFKYGEFSRVRYNGNWGLWRYSQYNILSE